MLRFPVPDPFTSSDPQPAEAVATILALPQRPGIRLAPPEPEIVPATTVDCSVLSALALAAKASWRYPQAWLDAWRPQLTLTPDLLSSWLVYLARRDNVAIGFYALSIEGSVAGVEHFWVAPDCQRQGVGRALFRHLVAQAQRLAIALIEIESDPNAEAFYQRMGARRSEWISRAVLDEFRVLPMLHYRLRTDHDGCAQPHG